MTAEFPLIAAEVWFLLAFCVFVLAFGRYFWVAVQAKLNARIAQIQNQVETARTQKEKTHEYMNRRKRDFNEIVARCHEIQEAADRQIEAIQKTAQHQIDKLEKDMALLLIHRLEAVEETIAQDTRDQLSKLCEKTLTAMLKETHVPFTVEQTLEDAVRFKEKLTA